jgi:hypothetical protein
MCMANVILNTTKMNLTAKALRNLMIWAFGRVLDLFWVQKNYLLKDVYIRVRNLIPFPP